jgi:hypothetical protein
VNAGTVGVDKVGSSVEGTDVVGSAVVPVAVLITMEGLAALSLLDKETKEASSPTMRMAQRDTTPIRASPALAWKVLLASGADAVVMV